MRMHPTGPVAGPAPMPGVPWSWHGLTWTHPVSVTLGQCRGQAGSVSQRCPRPLCLGVWGWGEGVLTALHLRPPRSQGRWSGLFAVTVQGSGEPPPSSRDTRNSVCPRRDRNLADGGLGCGAGVLGSCAGLALSRAQGHLAFSAFVRADSRRCIPDATQNTEWCQWELAHCSRQEGGPTPVNTMLFGHQGQPVHGQGFLSLLSIFSEKVPLREDHFPRELPVTSAALRELLRGVTSCCTCSLRDTLLAARSGHSVTRQQCPLASPEPGPCQVSPQHRLNHDDVRL